MRHILILLLFAAGLRAQAPIRGFSDSQLPEQRAREAKLKALPEATRARAYQKRMSESPHHAGSPASKAVAEYALGLLREWGLDARIENFEALLPYPTARTVEMTAPVRYRAKLQEPVVAEDSDSGDAGQLPTYNAYSAAGDVTAQLVYVNYGVPADYDELAKQGIDVKGKVVIARYGQSWRGVKPKVAAERGAIACLIYSDPREDGYFVGDVFPKGPFRPPAGVQRGSVMDMSLYPGDPLSPGWASEPGSKRLTRAESRTLMKIPVLPISYEDARPLLENLGGPVAPEPWRGALPLTYHLGPGPATVNVKLEFDWSTRPLHNVIATIPGSVFPDEWVLYGNHHDAWVNGASDPLSGAAALLEVARALAELSKQGWKPRRTIKLVLWDGEEFGLVGSTEWVEKHREILEHRAVAYINTDSNGIGNFGAGGSPVLEQFMTEILRDVADPAGGKTVLETARARRQPGASDPPSTEFRLGPLGSGSDYVAFVHHAGIPSLNLGFGTDGSGGIYHSIYDSFDWYSRFSDKDFVYGKALAHVTGTALLRLADAPVLPFEFGRLARTVKDYLDDLRKQTGLDVAKLEAAAIDAEIGRLASAARAYNEALDTARAKFAQAPAERLRRLNEVLMRSERALTLPEGLPGRDWYKHMLYAPGQYTGYGAKTLPGIREAAEAKRWDEANREARRVVRVLAQINERVVEATRLLGEM